MKRTRVIKLGINFRLVSFSRISYNRTNDFMDSQIILLLAKILHEWKKLDSKGYIRVFNFVSFITYSFDYILSYNKKQDSMLLVMPRYNTNTSTCNGSTKREHCFKSQ